MKKELRIKVWNKCNKCCAYCGEELEYKKMQVDHVISQKHFEQSIAMKIHGNITESVYNVPNFLMHLEAGDVNHFDNLLPSCRLCNYYKREFDLEKFRFELMKLHERILVPSNARLAVKYGIIEPEPFDGEFYFETLLRYKGGL